MVLRLRATSLVGLLVLCCVLLSSLGTGAAATAVAAHPRPPASSIPVAHVHKPVSLPRRIGPHAGAASLTTATTALSSPLAFEPNVGQTDPQVRYLAHGPGYTLFLTDTAALLTFLAPHARRRSR